MDDSDLVSRTADVLSVDADAYRETVLEEADDLKTALSDGVFDNPQAIVGFEYEFYAVDADDASLVRVPRRLLELIGFEKELGLHNAEMTTSPQPLSGYGLRAQENEVKARLETALSVTDTEGMRLVSDGLWTIPPEGETATGYLTESVDQAVDVDGEPRQVTIAANMSDSARYHAMANTDRAHAAGMRIDVPNVTIQADTVMPESLITSIQPHYQVPHAPDLPAYFNYALRIAGPLLALGVNSPFFPPDCYDDGTTAEAVLSDGWMEHRISVFETVLNANTEEPGKVRFPQDLTSTAEAVDRIAADDTVVPMPVTRHGRYDDRFAHLRQTHGTYWRWVRPVFDGASRSAANARIEFRPIPAQPTVRDSIAFQAVFAGLMESLTRLEHPIQRLDWELARENFYGAMRNGLDADLFWITNDGQETTDVETLYEDLFAHAVDGLTARSVTASDATSYVYPLRTRVERHTTPASWKRSHVSERVENQDESLATAIEAMQRAYVENQTRTLLDGSFVDWMT
ncbi:hypothetical protein [Halovivax gelatinilyticus]|uniref:hypothetical protein n=1 Tax=Halovivax gelatinilyticus TaxID=2961597 RepID=UPI0020CA8C50|nr:hypothetical protein [Halovivax gelatinilyticus]